MTTTERPVVFGEVLYDTFPDNSSVLGGAPFNVAWNLKGFGCDPLFVSSVGNDAPGEGVKAAMASWNMDWGEVATDFDHPTGQVSVALADGQPTFSILPDQAYDFIPFSAKNLTPLSPPTIIYHGSLALRSEQNRQTLRRIQDACNGELFLDVNLRNPWWKKDELLAMLGQAGWAKLNDDEMALLGGSEITDENQKEVADGFRKRYLLKGLIVTRGAKGALIATEKEVVAGRALPPEKLVDTVGAGDAFASVAMLGLLRKWENAVILERALDFASLVCGMRGATSMNKSLYTDFAEGFSA